MESQYKSQLKSIVLNLRHTLEGRYDDAGEWHPGDLEDQLAAIGVRRDRDTISLEQLPHLSEDDCRARQMVDAFIRSNSESGSDQEETIREFLQQSAYTWANRLIALRCMEARGLIDEIILQKESYGGRSLKHNRLAHQDPEACAGEDDGLYAVLLNEFAERAEEGLPLLFRPDEPVIALKPGVAALKKCIQLLSAPDEVFIAPDALGWAYQYWNTEEKDRVFAKIRTVKGAKIEKTDIIPVTQLYTEPYMVKFLVQNSLGALWMAMHPDSRLCDSWPYYVRDADRSPVEKKPLRQISFLDPSVGSGHFLLEAFDLLYSMYEEEGELKTAEEICGAILSHNLYGIDIDERSTQIAGLALYLKAKEKAPDFPPQRINLVATNVHPTGDMDHLGAFLAKHPEDEPLRNALELVFDSLHHADELGTLLQIEEPVENEFHFLKAQDDEHKTEPATQNILFKEFEKPEQQHLPLGVLSYETWKNDLLDRLKAHFQEEFASADFSSRFFGETAEKGLSLFDFLSRRYDVVATNPPYMGSKNMGPVVKKHVEKHFKPGKRDLYAAFILRCLELAKPETGRVAMVTQQSWMFLRSFADLRALDEDKLEKATGFTGILRETSIETLAHLGAGAFGEISGEVVNIALFSLTKKVPSDEHRLTAFRLIGPKNPEEKDKLLKQSVKLNSISMSRPNQERFVRIIESPLVYWVRDKFFKILQSPIRINVGENKIAGVHIGLCTGNNNRFIRFFWEIDVTNNRWPFCARAGRYQKWFGLNNSNASWRIGEIEYSETGGSRVNNSHKYFKDGVTYGLMSRGAIGARLLWGDEIFEQASIGVIPVNNVDPISLLVLLNNRVSSFLLRVVTQDLKFNAGYVENMPYEYPDYSSLLLGNICVSLKRDLVLTDPLERSFMVKSFYEADYQWRLQVTLHSIEAILEMHIAHLFNLSVDDISQIVDETGTPAGWFPMIDCYDTLEPLYEGLPEIPSEVIEITQTHARRSLEIEEIAELKIRLMVLYKAGPGTKEEIDDTDGEASDDDEEESERIAVGARIPIPAETFLEELSQKLEIHPLSVYWLLKEGIEKEGWRCLPEERRITKDRFTVMILRLLGHRWPKQVEAGESIPEWSDKDGIIPLSEGTDESTLYARLRERLATECGDERVSSEENTFEEVIGKPLSEWVRKDFFRHHISQFKKRPIAWHISSGRWNGRPRQEPAFECLVYCHKMDGDLLHKIRNQYVGPLIKRLDLELRGLENGSGSNLSSEQEIRRDLLRDQIPELKAFDGILSEIIAIGFGPESMRSQLRQYALNDAMLCLKARWLNKLSGVMQDGPLWNWKKQADQTGLHADFSTWISEAMIHLDHHCAVIGPVPPEEKMLETDPTAKELAQTICEQAEAMMKDAIEYANRVWWKLFDTHVLKPVSEKIKEAKKRLQELKEKSSYSKNGFKEQSDIKRAIKTLKSDIKIWQNELALKSGQGQKIKDIIESWSCPEALTLEPWLAGQEMYDQLSSLNARRPPPRTVQEFIQQESLYQPDINDGVRVNVAPLQEAGLLAANVLADKDMKKAITDRASWRDDERRWCREGKLPKPGWWE